MQNVFFRYTAWMNRRHKRKGHLFQGRYKAFLVDSDSYLLELIRYIHLNPVRVGMADLAERYPWSSHRAYLGLENTPWLTEEWVLGQFGPELVSSRERYARFIADGIGKDAGRDFFIGGEVDNLVLGDEPFVRAVLGPLATEGESPALEEIVSSVCAAYGLSAAQLGAKGRGRREAEGRAVVALVSTSTGCGSLTELATAFGRDVATLSTGVRRLRKRIESLGVEGGDWRAALLLFNVKV